MHLTGEQFVVCRPGGSWFVLAPSGRRWGGLACFSCCRSRLGSCTGRWRSYSRRNPTGCRCSLDVATLARSGHGRVRYTACAAASPFGRLCILCIVFFLCLLPVRPMPPRSRGIKVHLHTMTSNERVHFLNTDMHWVHAHVWDASDSSVLLQLCCSLTERV